MAKYTGENMPKKVTNKESVLEDRLKVSINSLKEQQKNAQLTWDKCQGAIEVLEVLLNPPQQIKEEI